MNKTIWKYELDVTDNQIDVPENAEILSLQTQNETMCLWFLVDPTEEKEERRFEVFGTGHDIGYDMGVNREYIGSCQLRDGALVFHVFEYTGV